MAQQTIEQQKTVSSCGNLRSHTHIPPKARTHVWDCGMWRVNQSANAHVHFGRHCHHANPL